MNATHAWGIPLESFAAPAPDPDSFVALLAVAGFGILAYAAVTVLVVFGAYWVIRLAVRHAGMDVGRWQRAGMPARMPPKSAPPRNPPGGPYFQG